MVRLNPAVQTVPLLALAALLLAPAVADAQRFAVNLRAGTHGIAPGVTIRVLDRVNVRGDLSFLRYRSVSTQVIQDIEVEVTADAHVDALAGIVDLHPFAGAFRLSAGLAAHSIGVDFDGVAASGYSHGGLTFTREEVGGVSGQIRTADSLGPYVGVGYGNAMAGRVAVTVDLGAIIFHRPVVELDGHGMFEITEHDVWRFDDAIHRLFAYPVLAVGLSFRVF